MPMPSAKNSEQRDLFRDALEMMVLQCLRHQPMHGHALVQYIQQRSEELLHLEEGVLYPALQRMLRAKLVTAKWTMSPTNRRVRTYQITEAGTRHLEREMSSFEQMLKGIYLVLSPAES